MALKPDRRIDPHSQIIDYKLAQVAEPGVIVTYDAANAGFFTVPTSVTGLEQVGGILISRVVNKDFNAVPRNFQRREVGLSGAVNVVRRGEFLTNKIQPGATLGPGSGIYLADGGDISNVASGSASAIGHVIAAADSDGYVRIALNVT
jgi:hypothetical protein